MRAKGKIAFWDDEKGYGFIEPDTAGKRVFIHIKAFNNPGRRPQIDQVVTFSMSSDRQGRPCAVKASLADDHMSRETQRNSSSPSSIGSAVFLALVGILVVTEKIPSFVLTLYIITSLITFIVYAVDKSAAQKGAWRTQESTLHLLSLVGGWPGALVAQRNLRHKSRKQPFLTVFWITVLLNCATFVWLLTPTGLATLHSVIASVTKG